LYDTILGGLHQHILGLRLVPPSVVVINCGDAKCIVIAGVALVPNFGHISSVDQNTCSFHGNKTTLVFDVRMGHTEATTFNAWLLITIINNIIVVDDDAPNATVRPCARVFSHLLDQIFTSSMSGLTVLPVFVLLTPSISFDTLRHGCQREASTVEDGG
jgi:hypothetical protein